MSAFKRFTPAQLDALKRGRAIPFLVEHRDAVCPGYSLSVIGTLEDEKFCGLFLEDDAPDCEMVQIPIDGPMLTHPYGVKSDSADAHAIHRLWSSWDAGMRATYLDFFALMGRVLTRERLLRALEDLQNAPRTAAPKRRARAKPQHPKPRKRRARA